MFVITADQVGSRTGADLGRALVARLDERHTEDLLLPADQTAGDEVQLALTTARGALDAVLDLARTGEWSVGLGVGGIRTPLPDATRKATGPAFIAAREAVDAAKRADGRFALRASVPGAEDVEALIRLLLLLRERRTEQGWEVVDLMADGRTQRGAAEELGITPAAVSMRLSTANWRADEAARPALVTLLERLDGHVADAEAKHGD